MVFFFIQIQPFIHLWILWSIEKKWDLHTKFSSYTNFFYKYSGRRLMGSRLKGSFR